MDRLRGDPSLIGPFRLLGRLGEGGMGRVYLGASPGGRKVAIKVVHPHYASDPEFRRRLAREVDAARQVGGFHTAAVVAADPGADPPWMATAYIPGPSLAEAISQFGPLDEAGVRALGAALAEGLAAIHACGLIHRDLKPANVILADDGPRIIDFGIAKGTDATALTGSNAVIGTLRYMSPEQLHGQELTPHSDIFALGAILAYAATGHDPFEAPTIPAVITRILNGPPSLDPLVGDLRDIIADCLAKQPGSRPGPASLLTRLRPPQSPQNMAPLPASPSVPPPRQARQGDPPAPRDQPHPRGHRRRMAVIAAGTTAAVTLAVLGVLLLLDNHPASTVRTTLTATLTDPGHGTGHVYSVAFGPDGTLATGDSSRTCLWNITTGHITATFPDPSSKGVFSLAFGPDGTLATADNNGSAYLWNIATRHIIATFTDPSSNGVDSVAFGPDGTLATADNNGSAYLWNIATRHIIATFTDPSSNGANSVAFGPDGTLATADNNGSAYLWNIATRHITATFPDPSSRGVALATFGSDGTLAVGDYNGSAYLWNIATRQVTATFTDPSSQGINQIVFGPDGALVIGDRNGSTYLWNTGTRQVTATLTDPDSDGVDSVAFGPDGILATGDYNGSTYLW